MIRERLLVLIDCLSRYSSKEEPLTLGEIKQIIISEYDLELTDKMVRNELNFLENTKAPYNIVIAKSKKNHKENVYYLKDTAFQLYELRYLMDAISAARFISEDETRQLIYKLRGLTDEKTSKRLSNELIYSEGKVKIKNFSDNIQKIHDAIKAKKCVKFQYGRYNVDKDFILSRGGDFYEVTPLGVIWSQEYYYLIARERNKDTIINYRIDRMRKVQQSEIAWVEEPGFDLEKYVSTLFHMYSGEQSGIAIEFDAHLINVVIDRFGLKAKIKKLDNNRFLLEVDGVVSMGLVRWLLTWGADAKAVRPAKLVDMMKKEVERYEGMYS